MRTSIVNVYKSKVSPTKILIQQNLQMNNKLATSELRYASQNAGRLTRKNYLAEMLDMFIYMSTMPISVWKTLANFLSQRLQQRRLGGEGGVLGWLPIFPSLVPPSRQFIDIDVGVLQDCAIWISLWFTAFQSLFIFLRWLRKCKIASQQSQQNHHHHYHQRDCDVQLCRAG